MARRGLLIAGLWSLGAALRAQAQDPTPVVREKNPVETFEFGEAIEVVGTAPVPGLGTPLRDVPASVQTFGGKDVARQRPLSAADFLERNAASVNLNSGQGNPYQPEVNFRGFTASPLLGTPQGVSVLTAKASGSGSSRTFGQRRHSGIQSSMGGSMGASQIWRAPSTNPPPVVTR